MGGTITQNFVQNGILSLLLKVNASIWKNIEESNKKVLYEICRKWIKN